MSDKRAAEAYAGSKTDDGHMDRRRFLQAGAAAGASGAGYSLFGGVSNAWAASFSQEELCYMPASLQLQLFRRRVLSPVEVLEAQIARIEKYNGEVNCITYKHYDAARKGAKESEARWKNGTARALEGITVGVKDEHGLGGWTMTEGSVIKKDNKLKANDALGDFLINAGAVLHIQTTVPEFYLHFCTWTKLWGVSRNPWNLDYSVGGSSGGSGAALAAGFCTIATGSDMGGSIRIPAAWGGVYGFKPPFGRVPTTTPLAQFSTSGPMARTFEDMVRLQNVIAHPHPSVMTTLPHQELPLHYPSVKGMRIAYIPDQGWTELDPEVVKATDAAVKLLQDLGATVERVPFKLPIRGSDISDAFAEIALPGTMGGAMLGLKDRLDDMTTYARYFHEKALSGKYGAKQANEIEQKTQRVHAEFQKQVWGRGFDVMINPTIQIPHTPADYDFTKAKPTVNGKQVHPLGGVVMTPMYNFLNWYPVVNAPVGLTSKRVPMGMQIIANSYQDEKAMRVAAGFAAVSQPFFKGSLMPDFRKG
ncbi:MAG: amidase [Hyphomicrobiaceae bacterium]